MGADLFDLQRFQSDPGGAAPSAVTEAARQLGSSIDGSAAEAEFQSASTTVAGMEGKPQSPEKLKAQQQLNIARARMQASKVAV